MTDTWTNCLYSAGNTIEDDDFSVSTLLEKANVNVGMYISTSTAFFCHCHYYSSSKCTVIENRHNPTLNLEQKYSLKQRNNTYCWCYSIYLKVHSSVESLTCPKNYTIKEDEYLFPYLCLVAGKNLNEPLVMFGDIAIPTDLHNADPCIERGCLWPKATDGNVYVPFRISDQYCE